MKIRKLFLPMAVSFIFAAFSAAVNASAEKAAFDYSAEEMECRIAPPVIDTEEADRNRDLLGAVTGLDWNIGPEEAILTIIIPLLNRKRVMILKTKKWILHK